MATCTVFAGCLWLDIVATHIVEIMITDTNLSVRSLLNLKLVAGLGGYMEMRSCLSRGLSQDGQCTGWVTKSTRFFVKQGPCNGNFVFRFRARSVLHISVFIFAAWGKLFYAHGTVKKR